MKIDFLFKSALVVALFLLLGLVLNRLVDQQLMTSLLASSRLPGELLFLLIGALLASVGLSRQFIAFLGGYTFGLTEGVVISSLAALFGCMLTYAIARSVARGYIQSRLSPGTHRLNEFLNQHTFATTLLIRLMPFGSNVLVNLVAGAAAIRPLAFFAGSGLGYIPQMLIFALIGSGIAIEPGVRISVGVVLFVLSAALGIYLYHRYRAHEWLSETAS